MRFSSSTRWLVHRCLYVATHTVARMSGVIVTAPRVMHPLAPTDFAEAEARLDFTLPDGYRRFMCRYGASFFCNEIRVRAPAEQRISRPCRHRTRTIALVPMA